MITEFSFLGGVSLLGCKCNREVEPTSQRQNPLKSWISKWGSCSRLQRIFIWKYKRETKSKGKKTKRKKETLSLEVLTTVTQM